METKTIRDIKSDSEFVSGIELTDFGINAYILHQPNTDLLKYFAYLNGELLDSGEFKPILLHEIESLPVLCQVLELVMRQPGNQDQEETKESNERKAGFLNSEKCEMLKSMLVNMADTSSIHHAQTKLYLEMGVCL